MGHPGVLLVDRTEALVGLRLSFSAHVRRCERGAPVLIRPVPRPEAYLENEQGRPVTDI